MIQSVGVDTVTSVDTYRLDIMPRALSKYEAGQEFPNQKRLKTYMGSHPKFKSSVWIWECMNCGKEGGPSMLSSITRPKRPSCCYRTPSGSDNYNWRGHESIHGSWIRELEYGALKRGYEWSITPEDMWVQWLVQEGRCAYTGWELNHGDKGRKHKTASIDRIDNSKGYIVGNIQWVHQDVNIMKSVHSEEWFLTMVEAISENRALCKRM